MSEEKPGEGPERSREGDGQRARVMRGWRPGRGVVVLVVVAVAAAAGLLVPRLLDHVGSSSSTESSAATLPTPSAVPSFKPVQDSGSSFRNGAKKLWELDVTAAFPDLKEPGLCLAKNPYDPPLTGERSNALITGPLHKGPLVIGDIWVIWVSDCHDLDTGKLAGISAETGEVAWSLDAHSWWSCDALPDVPKIACVDREGYVFTMDEAGTRENVTKFSGKSDKAEDAVWTGLVDSWAGGAVVVLSDKGNPATSHLLGLNGKGEELWREEFSGEYGFGSNGSGALEVNGDVFRIRTDARSGEWRTEQLRSAKTGEVLATISTTRYSDQFNVGPKILNIEVNPRMTDSGEGRFEKVDTTKNDYQYPSWPDGSGILVQVGSEESSLPGGGTARGVKLLLCGDQTTASCLEVPGAKEAYDTPQLGYQMAYVEGVPNVMVMRTTGRSEGTPKGYLLAPVDFGREVSVHDLAFDLAQGYGVSHGFNSVFAGRKASGKICVQEIGSGERFDVSTGDDGDWHPVPNMPENRLLLSKGEKDKRGDRKDKRGDSRKETHLAAWAPA